jgi:hypothetical protein
MKRQKPPQPVRRPRPPAGSIWSATATLDYVRDLERYTDYLEWRLRTPQQLKLEEAK